MALFKNIFSSEKKETLDKGHEKSKTSFFNKLSKAVAGKSKVDDDVLDNLEEVLVTLGSAMTVLYLLRALSMREAGVITKTVLKTRQEAVKTVTGLDIGPRRS